MSMLLDRDELNVRVAACPEAASHGMATGPCLRPAPARVAPLVPPHRHGLPLRVGTRPSPLALTQTRAFFRTLTQFCPTSFKVNAVSCVLCSTTNKVP